MILNLSLDLPAEACYVPLVRTLMTTLMTQLAIAPQRIDDAALVIGEVCANAVRHAAVNPRSRYQVQVSCHRDRVEMSVSDRGRGFRRSDVPLPTPGCAGGWGLWLVERLADSVVFEPAPGGGTLVRARMQLSTT
jgi:serine/threonine-protein kinase RsbW